MLANEHRSSLAVRVGSGLAIFSYTIFFAALLPFVLSIAFPAMRGAVAQRLATTAAIVVCVLLIQKARYLPRSLRLGIIPIWVANGLIAYTYRIDSPQAVISESGCEVVTDREPPEEIFLDSLDHAIRDDLSTLPAEHYLDLIYVAFLTYSLSHTEGPSDGLFEALGTLGLDGSEHEQFARDLTHYRSRRVEGGYLLDVWFCGYDLECGTCDDRGATYRWPENREGMTVPKIWVGANDELTGPFTPQR